MGFIFGLIVGIVVTGVVFIIFGKGNKKSITIAREALLKVYDRLGDQVEDIIDDIKAKDKTFAKEVENRKG